MSKFKIGDKVRVNTDYWKDNWPENYTFEVLDLYGDTTVVGINAHGDRSQLHELWLNLAKEIKQEKQMVNYHVLNDSIVLNYSGKTVVLANGDDRYSDVLECIRNDKLEDIPGIVEIERQFAESGIELRDGLVYVDNSPLPTELNARVLKFKEMKLPYASLLKFWDNLKKNPSYNARQMLFKFLEHNGHPLTQDGCFIAYRGVTEDFKDAHTKKFDNSPGSICEMPRELVDDNPNNTCSAGLHVACYDFAKGFASKLVEVKVNPADVVAVPTDYNGTKMRTCRFEVVQECEKMREETLYDEDDRDDEEEELQAWQDLEDEQEELDNY